jgi:glucan phosphoethanolaminetransferase (alkaline phosphatase superfamily)
MPVFCGILNSRWTFVYLTLRTTGTSPSCKTLAASVSRQGRTVLENNMDNVLSRPEFYYWYLIPTFLGLTILLWTSKLISKKTDLKNVCFTVLTFFLLGLSQWVLIQIFFFDAWPTFFPHIVTGLSFILVTIQYFLNRQDKTPRT